MKTRVMQNDPQEPTSQESQLSPAQPRGRMNLAARMARWSAHHRKKAVFGWLLVTVALGAISFVSPMKNIVFETSGPGESGRADTILYEDFMQPAGESVLIQSRSLEASDPEFQAAVQAVITGVSGLDTVAKVESPFDADNTGQISADKHSALVGLEIRGPSEDAGGRVRRSRRGGHSALAGPNGRSGDDGPRRAGEPGAADVRVRDGDHPLDRACGRRRLLDVLLEAGA